MNKLSVIFGLITLFVIVSSTASALNVVGVVLDRSVNPGESISHELNVTLAENEGPMNLTVEIMDWKQQLDGVNYPVNDSEASVFSAKEFFTATPREFRLDQGASQKVLITGTIPSDVGSGGRYAIFSVKSGAMPSAQDPGVGVAVAVNGLIRLTIAGSELDKSGEITELTVAEPVSKTETNASMIFHNTGNVHYQIGASMVLEDKDGNVLANATQPRSSNIIPEASRLIELSLKPENELEPGMYKILSNATLADGTVLATKELQFEIDSTKVV